MKNGSSRRSYEDERFGSGRSREGERIARKMQDAEQGSGSQAGRRQAQGQGGADESGGPTADEIAQRAYEKYLTRGGSDGHADQDWLEAEEELKRERRGG